MGSLTIIEQRNDGIANEIRLLGTNYCKIYSWRNWVSMYSKKLLCLQVISPTIIENVEKASLKLRLDSDNVAGVHLPNFKLLNEGGQNRK